MRNLLLLAAVSLFCQSSLLAQPFQRLGRASAESRFFYERIVPNTSVDVGILRERSMHWLQRELGTRGFDTATMQSPDTIRTYGYFPLRRGDGLRDIAVTFRVRMMPSTAGIYLLTDNFMVRGYDAVNGERYEIPFEEATDYFEGNTLATTRRRFDERFERIFPSFDRLTFSPPGAMNADGTTGEAPQP